MKRIFYLIISFSLGLGCGNDKKIKTDILPVGEPIFSQVVGIGKIIPENDIVQLSLPVSGLVQKIHKNENDSVSKGSIILELHHAIEDANIKKLEQEIKTLNLQVLQEKASLRENQILLVKAKEDQKRLSELFLKGAETKQNVENATTDVETREALLQKAKAGVSVAENRILENKAALEVARKERDQKILRSPLNGRILSCDFQPGESVLALQSMVQIRPEGKIIAIGEIDESYADRIAVGQKAWIRKVGTTDTLSTGTVFFTYSFLNKKSLFTDQAGEREDRRVRTIKMSLDQTESLLLNARVECVIDIADAKNQ